MLKEEWRARMVKVDHEPGSKKEMAIYNNFDLSSLAMHADSPINLLHLNPEQSTFTTHCCPGKLPRYEPGSKKEMAIYNNKSVINGDAP